MAKNLFIGNIPFSYDDQKLSDIVKQAGGSVVSAKVIKDKYSGRSRGFGFVEVASDDEAVKVIEALHNKDIDGRTLVVNEARVPKPQEN